MTAQKAGSSERQKSRRRPAFFQEPSWIRRQYIWKCVNMVRKMHDILPEYQELSSDSLHARRSPGRDVAQFHQEDGKDALERTANRRKANAGDQK
jgi:hypothetical protein